MTIVVRRSDDRRWQLGDTCFAAAESGNVWLMKRVALRPCRKIGLLIIASVWCVCGSLPSVSAQVTKRDRLDQVTANLSACVQTYAPAASAAGVRTTKDAVDYFKRICMPSPEAVDLS